jgi:hypothetical protein
MFRVQEHGYDKSGQVITWKLFVNTENIVFSVILNEYQLSQLAFAVTSDKANKKTTK